MIIINMEDELKNSFAFIFSPEKLLDSVDCIVAQISRVSSVCMRRQYFPSRPIPQQLYNYCINDNISAIAIGTSSIQLISGGNKFACWKFCEVDEMEKYGSHFKNGPSYYGSRVLCIY